MSETEALAIVKAVVDANIKGRKVFVYRRKHENPAEYTATIAVMVDKDDDALTLYESLRLKNIQEGGIWEVSTEVEIKGDTLLEFVMVDVTISLIEN